MESVISFGGNVEMEHCPYTYAECDDTAPDDVDRTTLIRLADPSQHMLVIARGIEMYCRTGDHCSGDRIGGVLRSSHAQFVSTRFREDLSIYTDLLIRNSVCNKDNIFKETRFCGPERPVHLVQEERSYHSSHLLDQIVETKKKTHKAGNR